MTNTKKPLPPKKPPPQFQVGDYVAVTVPTTRVDQGTVIHAGLSDANGYYAIIEHDDDDRAFYERVLELVHRPQPTDGGAEEYDEIMAGQTLMDQS